MAIQMGNIDVYLILNITIFAFLIVA